LIAHVLRPFGLAAVLVMGVPASPPAATTERVVTDVNTGLAISGIDPVAYFTDGMPVAGLADYELRYAGTVWRFRNPGNQAAFTEHPEVYMPRYGGYDPVAIGRGLAVPGNPLLWTIAGKRLYLFFNSEARDRFIADPGEASDLAEKQWPAVMSGLVP
jgi:YHS domain-containing protein